MVVDGLVDAALLGDGQLLIPAARHDNLAGSRDVGKLGCQLADWAVTDHQHLCPCGDLRLADGVHGRGSGLCQGCLLHA